MFHSPAYYLVVGLPGFEPGTSASRTQRATKLRYSPRRVPSQPDNPSRYKEKVRKATSRQAVRVRVVRDTR